VVKEWPTQIPPGERRASSGPLPARGHRGQTPPACSWRVPARALAARRDLHAGGRCQLLHRWEPSSRVIRSDTRAPHMAPVGFPSSTGPCKHPCARGGARQLVPTPSSFSQLLRFGLTGARILPVRLPDFHHNIFSRTGYISNQLLHHSTFQHKYMQCSAATILLAALLCNTDCGKSAFPSGLRRLPPRLTTRGPAEQTAPQNTLPRQPGTKLEGISPIKT